MRKFSFSFIFLFFLLKIQGQEVDLKFDGTAFESLPETQISAQTFSLELIFAPSENLRSETPPFTLLEMATSNGTKFSCIFNKNKSGKIGFFLENNQKIYSVYSTKITWQNDQFYHLTATWNGNSLFFYLNGVNEDSTDPFLKLHGNFADVKLGGSKSGHYFKGEIQAFRVWSKVLNRRQIRDLKLQTISADGEFVRTNLTNRRVADWLKMSDLITWKQTHKSTQRIISEVKKETQKNTNHKSENSSQKSNHATNYPKNKPTKKTTKIKPFEKSKKSKYPTESREDYLDKISDAPSTFVPKNLDYHRLIDRYEIKNGRFCHYLPSGVKPYPRKAIIALVDSVFKLNNLSEQDKFNLNYLLADNPEWSGVRAESQFPLWRIFNKPIFGFYKYKPDFIRVKSKYFDLHLNPVFDLQVGGQGDIDGREVLYYTNSRGAEFRGIVGKKVSFYSILLDNQAFLPTYVQNFTSTYSAVPSEGFWKKLNDDGAVDFLHTRGYIHFNLLKTTSLQMGYDRHGFGHGYRSLFLSEFASPYSFLKLNTKVWRITYTNLYAQLVADVNRTPQGELLGNNPFPKKYAVFHRLGIDFGQNLNLGIFESVVFGRKDNYTNDTFELGYLNPLIFYRSIEQQLGSSDNALIGLDWKWNFLQKFQFYGQLIIDELVLSEIQSGDGWWGNKQALQVGGKYIDAFGIQNLDLQAEINWVRPYVYTHFGNEELSNYAHYRQPLAHPQGANFREILGIINWQPFEEVTVTTKLFYTKMGRDETGRNWGNNILLDNTNRGIPDSDGNPQEYGHKIGQGIPTQILMGSLEGSFMLRHNLFFDAKMIARSETQDIDNPNNSEIFYIGVGFRLNAGKRLFEF